MEVDQLLMEAISEILGQLWYIFGYIVGVLITAFIGIVVDYMTGKLISNVQFMSFGFIIIATALILYLKFVK